GEVFFMMCQTPFRMDRSATGHDAGHAFGGHRHIGEAHARVDGEVVDSLFCLLDERVAKELPSQVFGLASDFFQRLIDGYGADGHRRVTDDPFAGLVNVLAGGEIHYGIGAPSNGPDHLFDFFFDGGGDRRVADVGIDLHQKIAADDHGLAFLVVDVGRDDRAATGDFIADKFRGNHRGNAGAPWLARVLYDPAAMSIP